jgi:hypothetical protein
LLVFARGHGAANCFSQHVEDRGTEDVAGEAAQGARTLLDGVEAKLSGKLATAGEELRPPRQK